MKRRVDAWGKVTLIDRPEPITEPKRPRYGITKTPAKDRTGERYGTITVIGMKYDESIRRTNAVCRCDCGNEFETLPENLPGRRTCGRRCQFKDLVGKQFGTLVVLSETVALPPPPEAWAGGSQRQWVCKCSQCGETSVRTTKVLKDRKGCATCVREKVSKEAKELWAEFMEWKKQRSPS